LTVRERELPKRLPGETRRRAQHEPSAVSKRTPIGIEHARDEQGDGYDDQLKARQVKPLGRANESAAGSAR
jgi:hypothetical protein